MNLLRRKKLSLVPHWRVVLNRAWSVRLALISAALSGAEVALPYIAPAERSGSFALLAGFVSIAAAVARLVAQPKLWK